jgi:hypothetical protein
VTVSRPKGPKGEPLDPRWQAKLDYYNLLLARMKDRGWCTRCWKKDGHKPTCDQVEAD